VALPVVMRTIKAAASSSEARRMVQGGGVSLNGRVVPSAPGDRTLSETDLHDGLCLLRVGKKHFFIVKVLFKSFLSFFPEFSG